MVMIEALACGTPVVAPPVASVPELVTTASPASSRPPPHWPGASPPRPSSTGRRAGPKPRRRFSLARLALDHTRFYEHVLERDQPATAVAQ